MNTAIPATTITANAMIKPTSKGLIANTLMTCLLFSASLFVIPSGTTAVHRAAVQRLACLPNYASIVGMVIGMSDPAGSEEHCSYILWLIYCQFKIARPFGQNCSLREIELAAHLDARIQPGARLPYLAREQCRASLLMSLVDSEQTTCFIQNNLYEVSGFDYEQHHLACLHVGD